MSDQDCHNCKHKKRKGAESPCCYCESITRYTKWEPVLA